MTCFASKKTPRRTSLTADCAALHVRIRVANALPLPVWQLGLRGPGARHGYRRADRALVAVRKGARAAIFKTVAPPAHDETLCQKKVPSL